MKKTVAVLTATRAEYGLLRPVINQLCGIDDFDVKIVVTGMHLSQRFGLTYQEIEQDGYSIDEKIEILSQNDSPETVSMAMGKAMIGFGQYFEKLKPDLIVALGDRYEALAVCCAAMNSNIPIAHIYGGELTQGAIDDAFRHSITKMSHLHFTSLPEYRKRVIQLGEAPDRVFTVGSLGVENIRNTEFIGKEELTKWLGITNEKAYAVVTFHPETLGNNDVRDQFASLADALNRHPEYQYIITKANADPSGDVINEMIDELAVKNSGIKAFASLGTQRYLSALKYAEMVIGNSSSGILEAPSFGIPTINIGSRQKGRIQSKSVINCVSTVNSISGAIALAGTNEFREIASKAINPYGSGDTSKRIAEIIKDYLLYHNIDLKKRFYDIDFNIS